MQQSLREGIERDSARIGDAWEDDWIMSILDHEYRARRPANLTASSQDHPA